MSDLPPPIYLPSSGGYTRSRIVPEPVDRRRFPFRRYSYDEEGFLVVRTKNMNRDPRPHPYEKSVPRPSATPSESRAVCPARTLDSGSATELLKQLIPTLAQDPESFESSALSIFNAHNIDPSVSDALVKVVKQSFAASPSEPIPDSSQEAPRTFTTSRANTPGPGPISLVPFKHERAFSSGSRGMTTWYSTEAYQDVPEPPSVIKPTAGTLYVHKNLSTGILQVWLFGMNATWFSVPDSGQVFHPALQDRVLSVRADGTPSWVHAVGLNSARARNREGRRVAFA
ncbi:hypothetical protein BJ322DRAFT_1021656 [Thelephora terrestris]|uniref:Uncharacterized protein n=1 Tax=Thelephora terrestris TaxID=56493 RepID=A0A9P6HC60_9AGAM|nr:hypothetical protein BJ322DRAFT_1021656 [Thelephora terrestris]